MFQFVCMSLRTCQKWLFYYRVWGFSLAKLWKEGGHEPSFCLVKILYMSWTRQSMIWKAEKNDLEDIGLLFYWVCLEQPYLSLCLFSYPQCLQAGTSQYTLLVNRQTVADFFCSLIIDTLLLFWFLFLLEFPVCLVPTSLALANPQPSGP